jgi:hypothetical protein
MMCVCNFSLPKNSVKGQLISKANSTIFTWTKKRTKYFSISALEFVGSSPTQGNMFYLHWKIIWITEKAHLRSYFRKKKTLPWVELEPTKVLYLQGRNRKIFHSVFGWNENCRICFRDYLTFTYHIFKLGRSKKNYVLIRTFQGCWGQRMLYGKVVYDRNHYFGLGPILKLKPKLADTFGGYRNRYYILKEESSYR